MFLYLAKATFSGKKIRRRKMKKSSNENAAKQVVLFHYFKDFHEDIVPLILSFVADGPFVISTEEEEMQSTLTHVLPFVNKAFRDLSKSDYFWLPILLRQLNRENSERYHWQQGLRRLLPRSFQLSEGADLLQVVLDHTEKISCKEIYKKVVTNHIQCNYPIFCMPCQLRLGEIYGLHLFEPRYRLMVRDLIDRCGNPLEACRGGNIEDGICDGFLQPPLLVHACSGSQLGPGETACLVQLIWCRTYEYGTADVQLLPISWVKLNKIWVRPSSGHLFYTNATRISIS